MTENLIDLEPRKIKPVVPALLKWFEQNARDLPWRRNQDPYAVWISEIMLQQTQVKTVIPYFERWMKRLPTVEHFANARPQTVLKLWEGLGYYSRARNAQAAAQLILRQHGGKFPSQYEDILALPGIGRYTAGAISSIAFNQPRPILDGNVVRVVSRIFGVEGNPREATVNERLWQLAEALVSVDTAHCSALNQSLMELGALVCTPRLPQCLICPVNAHCFAFQHQRQEEFPMLAPRPTPTARRFVAWIVREGETFLVRQRGENVVNARFWEFPNQETDVKKPDFSGAADGFEIAQPDPFCQVRHSITRYRILLEAYPARVSSGTVGHWKTLAELNRLPLTSAHRKILRALELSEKEKARSK